MLKSIKKATCTVASFLKRIQQINFKSEREVIEAYELSGDMFFYQKKLRDERFDYYFHLFDLKEGCVFTELTEKEKAQYSAIWRLVDLEGGCYE